MNSKVSEQPCQTHGDRVARLFVSWFGVTGGLPKVDVRMVDEFKAEIARAEEAMRERAAKVAEAFTEWKGSTQAIRYSRDPDEMVADITAAIRALEVGGWAANSS